MIHPVLYYSTNLKAERVSFREALLRGQAPDRGLYMPVSVPLMEPSFLKNLAGRSYPEVALAVARMFLADQIPVDRLEEIVHEAYNFKVPLECIEARRYVMRLDQGPTASFKDFAARMMGRLMQHFLKETNMEMLILTATSGDTGSAVANAFYGLSNIRVVVLFPESEVTPRQRKQMTTLRKNIQIIALDGKFDDCQALVKRAFADPSLSALNLSSANSINIGRLIPQTFYYFYAYSQLARADKGERILFSVPSGNFGNMMGGLLAREMGLPVSRFVIATNENDEVPVYWRTGIYRTIVPSLNCLSSAMNVGHPSNMARVVALYGGMMDEKGGILKEPDTERMRRDIFAISITDEMTVRTIREVYERYGTILEPHGAAGWAGLAEYLRLHPGEAGEDRLCVSLETAHPAKFPEEIRRVIGIDPPLPESMKQLDQTDESYLKMENDYRAFRDYLIAGSRG